MSKQENIDSSFRPIVGIDLGTTNSSVAFIQSGKPHIIPGPKGEKLTPSVVLIDPNEKVVVGEDAQAALIAMPERSIAAVKRQMGEQTSIKLGASFYSPEEISGMILEKLRGYVDKQLGEGEKEAVITVPAYFTDEQRRATKKAGELAGFAVERIINEPTAAALAFGFQHLDEDRHLLVYDLGGGTFDVSIVEMMDGILEVKASTGNNRLGGEDFDWLLVDWFAEKMIEQFAIDPRTDVRAKAVLKEEAEKVKKQLSEQDVVEVALPVVMMKEGKPLGLYTEVTKDQFVALIEPLLQETMDKISQILADTKLHVEEIDDILLVGGSSRIPRIHELIQDYFHKQPRSDVNPDEAVALGAAVQAGLKSGSLAKSGLIVTDVAPFSMGVAVVKETWGTKFRPGAFKAIIPRNTTIPVTRTETFGTVAPNQTEVMIEVYQGENEWVKDNHFLNEFLLKGIPPGPAGNEAVEVTFRYNLNGILEVTAKSVSTGESMTVTIQDSLDRSSEEAFQTSLEKVEASHSDRDEGDEEQIDLFDFLEEGDFDTEDEAEEDYGDLIEEATSLKERCEQALVNTTSKTEQKQLREVLSRIDDAIKAEDDAALDKAIEQAMDVLIDLDF
ncbi:Hsp70 family protein [Lederbergia sp. NSJ-179]|uniref:Hsp70 family protein n=1 Tax=Lederbergia sp. NSJ-179 TaxID=2931402 RepID=UPI001FD0E5AB|nr:Hsp70 family protein [Lederbergia sp. NSJ-179]MCJ7843531.1 Hsp70 family protein [Lederbergia sp. NSJ-179]